MHCCPFPHYLPSSALLCSALSLSALDGKATPGSADDVSTLILNEYDDRVVRAVQSAFDIFDVNSKNEIQSVELERVLTSLGHNASMDDVTDLIYEIDPKNTGILGFNPFITHVIPYLRSGYDRAAVLSLDRLKLCFQKLDLNGDGTLNLHEFRHVVSSAPNSSTRLCEEELESIVKYLDIDNDGCISWNEFKRIYKAISDEEAFNNLPALICSALRKIQYSNLPNPFQYINLFVGLPFNYRRSVLADLSILPIHRLDNLICCNPSTETGEIPAELEIQFEVQVVRVSGVPSEADSRKDDVLHRSVRYMICKTDKPPSTDEPGNPPQFIGNVTKLHATVHPSRPDTWQFSNKEEMDPDKSCYVRCTASEYQKGESSNTKAASLDELYLFVELITTLRVPQSAAEQNSAIPLLGIGRNDHKDSMSRDRDRSMDRERDRGRVRERERERDGGRNLGLNPPLRNDALRISRDISSPGGLGTQRGRSNSTTPALVPTSNPSSTLRGSVDVAKSASFFGRFSMKSKNFGVNKSTSGLSLGHDNAGSNVDDAGDRSPNRMTSRGRENRRKGSNGDVLRLSTDSRLSRERGGDSPLIGKRKGRDIRDIEMDNDDDYDRDAVEEEEQLLVVEMCSGWVMIPITGTVKNREEKKHSTLLLNTVVW